MAQETQFDLVIIGSGPGGYVAAVHAVQLGLKTAVVEKSSRLGGVCLNVGCIPSKAMLDASEYYHLAKDRFAEYGIKTGKVTLDLATMLARKDKVVEDLTGNVRKLLEGNNIEIIHGTATVTAPGAVDVDTGKKKKLTLAAKNILLATGSEPMEVKGLEFDGEYIISSTEALSFDSVPGHLGIVGGGYIGLELGSVWNRLGSKVTVIEMLPKIAATLDGQVGRTLDRILKRQGLEFRLGTRVAKATVSGKQVKAVLQQGDDSEEMTFDRLLVSIGRRPLTRGLGIEGLGIETDPQSGQILVDETYRTSVAGIYAIGDLVPGPMLAHKASAEGIAAVECMAGRAGEVNYDTIPAVVYTWPEVASVGLTEEQVREREIPYCVGSFPFSGAGRARCMGETDGFVKLISHGKTDRILGVHIIGPRAADMIAECVLALEFGASSEDISRTIHGHPTFSEALMEAAMNVRKCSIYAS
jgi:dihydrolipoamide dehydrogenase